MKTHNKSNTKLYRVWNSMKQRCSNPNDKFYYCYGERGIKVCNDWLNDFEKFYNWAISNGYAENLTIDRIDVNGNYEPSNCRWVDNKTQQRNRRDRVKVIFKGQERTLIEISEETGIALATIYERHKRGVALDADVSRKKCVLRSDGVVFDSIKDAAKESNITHSCVSRVCNGRRKSTHGFGFTFLTQAEAEAELAKIRREKQ